MTNAQFLDRSAPAPLRLGSVIRYSIFTIRYLAKRALVLSLTDGLMQMKRTATYIIENVFENDVAALASWKSASHVEAPPKKKAPPPLPTPPDNDEPPTS